MFNIKGVPIAWKRPGRNNKTGIIYDQQKTEKEQLRWYLWSKYKEDPICGPIEVNFSFYMPMPKNSSGPRKKDMLYGVLHHITCPDIDNLCKFYLDVMNNLIYVDDRQICKLTSEKLYATEPYTLIQILPIKIDWKKQNEVVIAYDEDDF